MNLESALHSLSKNHVIVMVYRQIKMWTVKLKGKSSKINGQRLKVIISIQRSKSNG